MRLPRSGRLAIGALIVALAAAYAGWAAVGLAAGIVGATTARALLARTRPGSSGANSSLVVGLGAAAVAVRLVVGGLEAPVTPDLPSGRGPWHATVEVGWAPRDGQQLARLRVTASAVQGPEWVVLAVLPRFPVVVPGDEILVSGSLRAFADDERGDSLRSSGMVGSIRAERMSVAPARPGPARWLDDFRRAAGDALARVLPEPAAGLAAGILIGLRERVDRDLAADFTTSGVSHVVAISGWNIAIVGGAVGAFGGRLRRRRRAVLIAVAIGAYTAFAGASAAVLRAAAMAGVVLLARESARPARAATALGWAVFLLLMVDPGLAVDAGFQLSSAATAGLIAWAAPLAARLEGPQPGRIRAWLAESLGVSLAAQAATLPIVLLAFGRLSVVAPAVNLAVVPLVAPAMAAGLLALAGGGLVSVGGPAGLATILGLPAWALLTAIIVTVRTAAEVPLASIDLEPPINLVLAAIGVAIMGAGPRVISLAHARARHGARAGSTVANRGSSAGQTTAGRRNARGLPRSRAGRAVAAGLAIAVVAAGLAFVHRPDGLATITILDIGQGDAILVEGGRGGRLLVDGGPDPDRLLVALDEQLPPWDRRIDAIILTHPHEDHVAGLAILLGRYAISSVFETPMAGPGPGYAAWAERLRALPIARGVLATGSRLVVDDIRLRVLWPDPGTVPTTAPNDGTGINNASIVLLGEVAGRRFLLTGDVEDGVDPRLVERGLPTVDLLKVAHHGSRTSSTPSFLDAVRPTIAVASAGRDNPYGHPTKATMDRLAGLAQRVYRTDRDGSVTVVLGADRIVVRTSGPRTSRDGPGAAGAGPGGLVAANGGSGAHRGGAPAPVDLTTRFTCALPTRTLATARISPPVRLLYHRPDDGPGDPRRAPRPIVPGSSARNVLGRRRLRSRGGDRHVPSAHGRVPRRSAGTLEDPRRCRPHDVGSRPTDGAPRDRLDVRRWNTRRGHRHWSARQARRRSGRLPQPVLADGAEPWVAGH